MRYKFLKCFSHPNCVKKFAHNSVAAPENYAILESMNRVITYNIDELHNGMTILHYLKEQGYTRSVIVALKKTGEGILLNGRWAYVNEILAAGDALTVRLEETPSGSSIVPVEALFDIVYEDEDLLVVNKPAGMPVHPSLGHYEHTLANAVCCYFKRKGEDIVFRCVNRLDKDTTGLCIISKNLLAAGILNEQMRMRRIRRTYYAICSGKVSESGVIDAPIARKEHSTVERCVDFERGESAVTHYCLLSYDKEKDLSFVKVQPETGRTHQIRVHMKYIGHPLIGDFLYNPDFRCIDRQALHAGELSFVHPVTKEKMHFSSELPLEMKRILTFV